jgi:exodeoxyribonuclease VII large subunit
LSASFSLFHGPGPAAETPQVWTVSELTGQVRSALENGFSDVAVRGEISNLARPRSGHLYFQLKDDSAQLRSVLWKSQARSVLFDLEDGLAVRAFGDLTVYAPRGEYQLVIRKIEPEGIGALELAFRQVVERLRAEGLFDPGRKRPLPRFPRRIVVVSSPTGAAVRDFVNVAHRRWPAAEILVAPSRVQGEGAAEEIVEAIRLVNRLADVDFLVLARGGGSLEDLWAFNEEIVARAIFRSQVPVVSAVGHEVDVSVADLVADLRAPTPSAAAELCVPDLKDVQTALDTLGRRLALAALGHLKGTRTTLDALEARARLAIDRALDSRRRDLARLVSALDALSPLGVLARGYSLTLDDSGAPIRSADSVKTGHIIRTRLASGAILSRVERVEP